jgi:hypothetical protein
MSLCDEKNLCFVHKVTWMVGWTKQRFFSSQSDMVGWTKQRFSHHKVTWWAGQNKDFLITK